MTSVAGLYLIAVASLCLSVFNNFRYEELKNGKSNGKLTAESGARDETHSRRKRDTHPSTYAAPLPHNQTRKASVLPGERNVLLFKSAEELREFIQEEVNQSIQQYFNNAVELQRLKKKLRKVPGSRKCACPGGGGGGLPGARGEKGERGLRGPSGKRGLGLYPPRLRSRILDVTANASDSKVLSCKFFGNPIPVTRWQTNAHTTNVTIETDRENSEVTTSIQIKNITWEDRGNVTCYASTILGDAEASGLLTVHAPPIVSLDTELFFATLGTAVTFPECKVLSSPPAEITWKRGIVPLSKGRMEMHNGVLKISQVRVQDEGHYECVAKNYLGTSSKLIQLRTRTFQFSKKPSFITYTSNASVTLSCGAYGPPGRVFGKWMDMDSAEGLPHTMRQSNDGLEISVVIRKPGEYKCVMSDNVTTIEGYTKVMMFRLLNSSSIINPKQAHYLGTWLRSGNLIGTYSLCWSAKKHGFGVREFQTRCSGKRNTISIFQTTTGTVLGGFTDIPWKNTLYPGSRIQQYSYGSSKSFLFTFTGQPTKIPILSRAMKATCYKRLYGPCFGELELYYAPGSYYNRYKVHASIGKSYLSNEVRLLAGQAESFVNNVEVYYKV